MALARSICVYLFPVIPLLFFLVPPCGATSTLFYSQDAKAAGMAMAVSSSIDNPSAVLYNPAMLPYQKGFGFSQTQNFVIQRTSFTSDKTGKTWDVSGDTKRVPAFFIKYTANDLSFGVGVFSLFGMGITWPAKWDGQYAAFLADLNAVHINPVIAYRVNDYLSLGFGVSYVTSSFVQKSALNLGVAGEGLVRLDGDGEAYGFNVGATLKLPDAYTLSFTYRSAVTVDYKGKAKFSVPGPLAARFQNGPISTRINFPYLAILGLSKRFDKLTLETDLRLTGWSSTRGWDMVFETGKPASSQYIPKNWSNSYAFLIGANYKLNDIVELRAGYMYDETPVPASTLGPTPADISRNCVTGGIGFKIKKIYLDLAYQVAVGNPRSTETTNVQGPQNQPLTGRYEGTTQVIAFSLGSRF